MNLNLTQSVFVCHLSGELAAVDATVSDRRNSTQLLVRKASATSVLDAIAKAIGQRGIQFASELDEREACIAALRDRCVRVTRRNREITCDVLIPD